MTATGPHSLTQLGRPSELPPDPDQARLESVANPHPGSLYLVRFTCPSSRRCARSPVSPTSPTS